MKMEYKAVSKGITHVVFTATPEEEVQFIDIVPNYIAGRIDVFVADKTCDSFNLTSDRVVKMRRDADPIIPPEPYRAMQEDEIEDERVDDFIVKKTVILISEDAPITRIVTSSGDDMVLSGQNIHFFPEEREAELDLVCLVNFSIKNTTKKFLEEIEYPEPSAYEYMEWLINNSYVENMLFDITLYEANA